jgi:hypothetical protein
LGGCCCLISTDRVAAWKIVEKLDTGPIESETYRVEYQDAEKVDVSVQFAGGTLSLNGGSQELMDGQFTYNVGGLEPIVEYSTIRSQGTLDIRHKDQDVARDTHMPIRNEWHLVFGDRVPLDMSLTVGASQGTLDFDQLPMTDLHLDAGAADLSVRFPQPNRERISSLQVRSGVAQIEFVGLGNAHFGTLDFDGGLGTYTFDFGGDWRSPATARIQAGASRVTLVVPLDIGVRICPGDLRQDDYGELTPLGDCFANDLYGRTDIQLDVELDLGLGQLIIKHTS